MSCREVDGEMVILDRAAERVHQLNPTATFIWHLCDGGHSPTDIASELAEAFDVDAAAVGADVERALEDFERLRLVGRTDGSTGGLTEV